MGRAALQGVLEVNGQEHVEFLTSVPKYVSVELCPGHIRHKTVASSHIYFVT